MVHAILGIRAPADQPAGARRRARRGDPDRSRERCEGRRSKGAQVPGAAAQASGRCWRGRSGRGARRWSGRPSTGRPGTGAEALQVGARCACPDAPAENALEDREHPLEGRSGARQIALRPQHPPACLAQGDGVVGPEARLVDLQRPLVGRPGARQIAQVLQHPAQVVDICWRRWGGRARSSPRRSSAPARRPPGRPPDRPAPAAPRPGCSRRWRRWDGRARSSPRRSSAPARRPPGRPPDRPGPAAPRPGCSSLMATSGWSGPKLTSPICRALSKAALAPAKSPSARST